MKMALDIAKSLFRILASEGVTLEHGNMQALLTHYVRMAEDTLVRYNADAMINGLHFDRHQEETAVETFAQSLRVATEEFFKDPLGAPLIPNWNRITSALPGFLRALRDAVDADSASISTATQRIAIA